MLRVTSDAAQELQRLLEAHATDSSQVLRFDATSEGFSLGIGPHMEGDEVIENEGIPVLNISAELSRVMASVDIVLDRVETPEGPRLTAYRGEEAPPQGPAGEQGYEEHPGEQ